MSISKLLEFRESMVSNLLNPKIQAWLETQKKIENALPLAALKKNNLWSYYNYRTEILNPAINSFLETEPLARTIKGSSIFFKLLELQPVFNTQSEKRYLQTLKSIAPDFYIPSVIENAKLNTAFLSEINYDFLDIPADEEKEPAPKVEQQKQIIIDESRKVKSIITDIYLKNLTLFQLQPRQFEELIAELLHGQGFQVELTKQTHDGGFDILAIQQVRSQAPLKWLVECKKYREDRKIDVNIIRSFKEVIQTEKANRGIIATTSYFSPDALKKQEEMPYLLDFRDKDAVMEWVIQYWQERMGN